MCTANIKNDDLYTSNCILRKESRVNIRGFLVGVWGLYKYPESLEFKSEESDENTRITLKVISLSPYLHNISKKCSPFSSYCNLLKFSFVKEIKTKVRKFSLYHLFTSKNMLKRTYKKYNLIIERITWLFLMLGITNTWSKTKIYKCNKYKLCVSSKTNYIHLKPSVL